MSAGWWVCLALAYCVSGFARRTTVLPPSGRVTRQGPATSPLLHVPVVSGCWTGRTKRSAATAYGGTAGWMWFEIARRQSAFFITQICVSIADGHIDIVGELLKGMEPERLNWGTLCSVTQESYRVQTSLSSQWACRAQVSPTCLLPTITQSSDPSHATFSHPAIDCRRGTYLKSVEKSCPTFVIRIPAGVMTKLMEIGGPQPSRHECFRGLLHQCLYCRTLA